MARRYHGKGKKVPGQEIDQQKKGQNFPTAENKIGAPSRGVFGEGGVTQGGPKKKEGISDRLF